MLIARTSHLSVRLLLLLALVLRPDGLELKDDERVEDQDEGEGDGEPQDEGVEGERSLTVQDVVRLELY